MRSPAASGRHSPQAVPGQVEQPAAPVDVPPTDDVEPAPAGSTGAGAAPGPVDELAAVSERFGLTEHEQRLLPTVRRLYAVTLLQTGKQVPINELRRALKPIGYEPAARLHRAAAHLAHAPLHAAGRDDHAA